VNLSQYHVISLQKHVNFRSSRVSVVKSHDIDLNSLVYGVKWHDIIWSSRVSIVKSHDIDLNSLVYGVKWHDIIWSSRVSVVKSHDKWGSCCSNFSFLCIFCISLFLLSYVSFCPLYCLSFFDLRLGIFNLFISMIYKKYTGN
jgi:hypothetical protein